MTSFQRISILTLFICCVAVLYVSPKTTHASSLNLNVRDSVINIQADKVPLINILNAISEKTGLYIQSGDPMMEPVSCDLKGITVEEGIKRLLKNRSYVLTYRKTEGDRFVPAELRVLGNSPLKSVNNPNAHISGNIPEEDPMKVYKKEWFEREFGDEEKLSKQLSVTPVKQGPDQRGIRVKRLLEKSVFRDIGLREGDIISDVNGRAVQTAEEFIQALQSGLDEESPTSIIRIERLKSDRSMDPIYIELH